MKSGLTVLPASLLILGACGGGDDDGIARPDAAPRVDAGDSADAAPASCTVADDLGSPMGIVFEAFVSNQDDPTDPDAVFVDVVGSLNEDTLTDAINVQLWPGFGAFDPELVTGAVEIAGAEVDLGTCGACALLIGDFNFDTELATQDYMASGGTLTVATASTTIGETIEGSLAAMSYREVRFEDDEQVDVANGCTSTLTAVSFSATLQDGDAARRAGHLRTPRLRR